MTHRYTQIAAIISLIMLGGALYYVQYFHSTEQEAFPEEVPASPLDTIRVPKNNLKINTPISEQTPQEQSVTELEAKQFDFVSETPVLGNPDLTTFRNEVGGFSVVAPKKKSGLFCLGKCIPSFFSPTFSFTASGDHDVNNQSLSINVIVKNSSTTLETWTDSHMEQKTETVILNKKIIGLGEYSALQFDTTSSSTIYAVLYPSYEIGSFPLIKSPIYSTVRVLVVDLTDRYIVLAYILSYNKNTLYEYNNEHSNNQLLPAEQMQSTYDAIVNSFQAFTPKKF